MKLEKGLGMLEVFAFTSSAMFAGMFILPGLAYHEAGPAALVSFLLAALLAALGLISQAELATAMPRAGGSYFFVTRSLGPGVGTIYGLVTWVSVVLKAAFMLVSTYAFAALVLDPKLAGLVPPALALLLILINLRGVREGGKMQVGLLFILLIVLLGYIGASLPVVEVRHFEHFAPKGLHGIVAGAGLVFVAFGGILKIASVAEEVKDPGRDLPLGMALSLLVGVGIILLVVFVTDGVLTERLIDPAGTQGCPLPLTEGANIIFGPAGVVVLSLAAVAALLNTANAGLLAASRFPLALARDRLVPAFLGQVWPRRGVPANAVLATGLVISASLVLPLKVLAEVASSVLILGNAFTCLSVIILRESHLQNYRPLFRAPFYPWAQIAGIIGSGALMIVIAAAVPAVIWVNFALLGAGLVVYMFYGRKVVDREYALLHVIARLTPLEMSGRRLETELKNIVRERDDLIKDRFDHLAETAPVLDLETAPDREEFFRRAGEVLAERLALAPAELARCLREREEESTTALSAHLAIPHVVVPGEKKFELLIARCRAGIPFSNEAPAVRAVFVLAGTKDERPFHLRALAAIAQIVHDPDFERRWLKARSAEDLRDLLLLGQRHRH